ncbi:Nucleotide-binding universal stress protein, UspA family [Asanoa hainanensis]|uniref:Nucleotide-binding universal stress protein, UspA family n=1 Tax=Asanoa hainanensis TaxID=560556 RepID=A0A239P2L1_9ACTN|nr:universal stress protein [Asanoa hainanensis]SNT60884.1 Nucleotide-binding universal stress protein, UspA family [Asanoa hainanensis]
MNMTRIVVGVDGSEPSMAAARWAAGEAQQTGATVDLVHAFDWDYYGGRFDGGNILREWAEDKASTTLADAAAAVAAVAPGVTVSHEPVLGSAVPVLLEAAADASMIVVGNRGRGGFGSLLLGSVGQRLATHAPVPVVVVRGRPDIGAGAVVVGVDGSPAALDALAAAFRMAASRSARLIAVRAYVPPTPPWGVNVEPVVYDVAERDAELHAELDEQLAPWREKFPDVATETLVAHGSPAGVLVGLSHTARLVVVGTRGHGSVAGALTGSVGLQLVHHADCPVLIVR